MIFAKDMRVVKIMFSDAQSRKASDRRNSGAGGSLPSLTAEAAMALVMANIDHHRSVRGQLGSILTLYVLH